MKAFKELLNYFRVVGKQQQLTPQIEEDLTLSISLRQQDRIVVPEGTDADQKFVKMLQVERSRLRSQRITNSDEFFLVGSSMQLASNDSSDSNDFVKIDNKSTITIIPNP